ncbi:UNVERIFIED_ORG: hypothetical protein J2Y81_001948 [Paraburkholderia sediminicola]|nr:hypothetical protein [Paraburkholderia sediminicola]
MRISIFKFVLVVLIDAVCAVAMYLKDRLLGNLRRPGNDDPWANHPEFV